MCGIYLTVKQTGDEAELRDASEPCATKYDVYSVYNDKC